MGVHELAGKVAPYQILVNIPRLISAYYTQQPDPNNPAQQVAFRPNRESYPWQPVARASQSRRTRGR